MLKQIALLCVLWLGWASTVDAAVLASWTELDGQAQSVRAAVDGSACPAVTVDGRTMPMQLRQAASIAFPHSLCQASIAIGAKTAAIEGHAVRLLASQVQRIVVMGDTGCRIKKKILQACNDPKSWPFPLIAARAATAKPDLVIHVGDYLYRETECPADNAGCKGSPHGDDWTAWQADFFTPAKPLLEAAPWVFVRGNHEQCGRSAGGWFRMLDAGAEPLNCPSASKPFIVTLTGLKLMVIDSADTDDHDAAPDKVTLFRQLFQSLDGAVSEGHGWIVTHRPIWGFMPTRGTSDDDDEPEELPINLTEETAIRGLPLPAVDMILSGHIHLFSSVTFGPQRPAQLIVGNGGDLRDGRPDTTSSEATEIDGMKARALAASRFGYMVLDRVGNANRWIGTLYGIDNGVIARCDLQGRNVSCVATG